MKKKFSIFNLQFSKHKPNTNDQIPLSNSGFALVTVLFVLIILFVSFFYMKKKKPKFCLWVIFFLIGK